MLGYILFKKRNALPLVVWSFIVLNGETVCHAADLEDPPPDFWLNLKSDPIAFALSRLISEFSLFDFELDWFFSGVNQADLGSDPPDSRSDQPVWKSDLLALGETAREPRVRAVGKRPRARERPNSAVPRVPGLRQVHDKWSPEEDRTLQWFCGILGPKWMEISMAMRAIGYHRNGRQCQSRMIILFDRVRTST
ncbi:MAG: myb/SANT-like DNA-binding domain-containing protein [Puniceicoccales bacterium]|nr:myb/SANT-like DNA-binding domain-containing protein [Puniceicoccales bacterium]